MRYIPHTTDEIDQMLRVVGVTSIEDLFRSIPKEARLKKPLDLPHPLSEPELIKHVEGLAKKNCGTHTHLSFMGAGSYNHHVPAAVGEIIGRSEWLTPYTPYQPEISQGTLQAIFEYQTMICNLTGMEVANASHYDGATATAEALLIAVNKTRRNRVFIADSVHPEYRATTQTVVKPRGIELCSIPFTETGQIDLAQLKELLTDETAAVVVGSPNFFGIIEDLEEISKIVKGTGTLFIVAIEEPVSLGILVGPGDFGADIVAAEGQAFGGGLNFGGPYLGILATREKLLRSMPGRISGATTDRDERRGFVLTMSTREQHIRREKAFSNICSNEALCATTAAIYLALMGKNGLKRLAEINLANAQYLKSEIKKIGGFEIPFSGPTFNEFVVKLPTDSDKLIKALMKQNIFAGVNLGRWYEKLADHLLITTTEVHTKEDLDRFIECMSLRGTK